MKNNEEFFLVIKTARTEEKTVFVTSVSLDQFFSFHGILRN